MSQNQSKVSKASKAFPQATFAQSSDDALKILDRVPQFKQIVDESLLESPVILGDSKRQMIQCAAAEMCENGMLHEAFETSSACRYLPTSVDTNEISRSARERIIRRDQIKELRQQRAKIVGNLQSVGILPGGLAWFALQWVVMPILMEILKRWCLNWYFDEVQAIAKVNAGAIAFPAESERDGLEE